MKSLKELFSIANYLEYGYGLYVRNRVPDKFRKDILNSYLDKLLTKLFKVNSFFVLIYIFMHIFL